MRTSQLPGSAMTTGPNGTGRRLSVFSEMPPYSRSWRRRSQDPGLAARIVVLVPAETAVRRLTAPETAAETTRKCMRAGHA